MSAHTKGPWAADVDGAHVATVSGLIHITAPLVEVNARPDDDRMEADARLIAAAPELLAALRDAHEALEWCSSDKGRYIVSGTLETARAAIAKAEGK